MITLSLRSWSLLWLRDVPSLLAEMSIVSLFGYKLPLDIELSDWCGIWCEFKSRRERTNYFCQLKYLILSLHIYIYWWLIDILIDNCLTSSEQYFSYIKDECMPNGSTNCDCQWKKYGGLGRDNIFYKISKKVIWFA
jgi:hypothetical protein